MGKKAVGVEQKCRKCNRATRYRVRTDDYVCTRCGHRFSMADIIEDENHRRREEREDYRNFMRAADKRSARRALLRAAKAAAVVPGADSRALPIMFATAMLVATGHVTRSRLQLSWFLVVGLLLASFILTYIVFRRLYIAILEKNHAKRYPAAVKLRKLLPKLDDTFSRKDELEVVKAAVIETGHPELVREYEAAFGRVGLLGDID